MRDHSRGRSNKKAVGYRTPSRWKAENPQAFQRNTSHWQEPSASQLAKNKRGEKKWMGSK